MLDRIKIIMDEKELNASTFADMIQVSRGTVSHILNGRNQPSKDTIDKILQTFPDISSSWFLKGESPMYKSDRIFNKPLFTPVSRQQPDLFDEKTTIESHSKSDEREYLLKKGLKRPENIDNPTVIQSINPPNNISKKIDRIMIFFSDKTFMTFIPEE